MKISHILLLVVPGGHNDDDEEDAHAPEDAVSDQRALRHTVI